MFENLESLMSEHPLLIFGVALMLIMLYTLFRKINKRDNLGHDPGTYTVQGLDKDDNVIGEIDVQARNRYEAVGKADADLQAYAYQSKKKEE